MKFSRTIKDFESFLAAHSGRAIVAMAAALATVHVHAAPANGNTAQASKVAIVTTTRQPNQANNNYATLQPTSAPSTATSQVIYKLVDAQGRTTYANAPMTGAQKVDSGNRHGRADQARQRIGLVGMARGAFGIAELQRQLGQVLVAIGTDP